MCGEGYRIVIGGSRVLPKEGCGVTVLCRILDLSERAKITYCVVFPHELTADFPFRVSEDRPNT